MPEPTALAGCIVCDKDGGVLMLHRTHQYWEIPGGKRKTGETLEAAAIRELKEEMNIAVRLVRKLGSREFESGGATLDYTWFLAEVASGEPQLQELHTYDKWGYFSLVSLTTRYDELSPGTKSFLEAIAYGEIDIEI